MKNFILSFFLLTVLLIPNTVNAQDQFSKDQKLAKSSEKVWVIIVGESW